MIARFGITLATVLLFVGTALFAGAACNTRTLAAPGCLEVGTACSDDAQCCSWGCVDGTCATNPHPGGVCRTSNDCGSGGFFAGTMRCTAGECEVGCRAENDVCKTNAQCCSQSCIDGKCTPPACRNIGGSCDDVFTCCPGAKCVITGTNTRGTCADQNCRSEGTACSATGECCPGMGCPSGACSTACRTLSQTCANDNECCLGTECRNFRCTQNCIAEGSVCNDDTDCCEGTTCRQRPGVSTKTCEKKALGTACGSTAECSDPYVCTDGFCRYAQCQASPFATCTEGTDCCSGRCSPQQTCCRGPNDSCTNNSNCCAPDICRQGTQRCGPCLALGDSCSTSYPQDCCSGRCGNGTCCAPAGQACADATQCCNGLSCAGTGTKVCCAGVGQSTNGGSVACCEGLVDDLGTCKLPVGGACTSSAQCGSDVCLGAKCCQPTAATCSGNSDCCSGSCTIPGGSTTGTCDASAGGEPCDALATCAAGYACDPSTDTCCGQKQAACDPAGGVSCCGGPPTLQCSGTTAKCCVVTGGACTANPDCCSGSCKAGGAGANTCN